MVLTKPELIESFQNEVRILLHLAGKVEPSMLDYRPTPGQRSTLELLRYLTVMGPALTEVAIAGAFDPEAWSAAEQRAEALTFDEATAAIAAHNARYAELLEGVADEDFRAEVAIFGPPTSRGSFLVNQVLAGCAAYRTQLFLYLKACGREELNTMNLWVGEDG